MRIGLFPVLILSALAGCAPNAGSILVNGYIPKVVLTGEFSDFSCKRVHFVFGLPKEEGGYGEYATVHAKAPYVFGPDYGVKNPWPAPMLPGDYKLVSIACRDNIPALQIGQPEKEVLSKTYKFDYGALQVPNAPLVYAGHIVVHTSKMRVTSIEVKDMQPESRAALQQRYPEDFPLMQTSLVRLDGDLRDLKGAIVEDSPNTNSGTIVTTTIIHGRH
jgi:hypothetical protein